MTWVTPRGKSVSDPDEVNDKAMRVEAPEDRRVAQGHTRAQKSSR